MRIKKEDWISVKQRTPFRNQLVIAIAPSGYRSCDWRIFIAEYDPSYKGWVTICNTRITDYGEDVQYWLPLSDNIELP